MRAGFEAEVIRTLWATGGRLLGFPAASTDAAAAYRHTSDSMFSLP